MAAAQQTFVPQGFRARDVSVLSPPVRHVAGWEYHSEAWLRRADEPRRLPPVSCIFALAFVVGRRPFAHRRHPLRSSRRATTTGDEHAVAVESWMKELVIGHEFCPWARPAQTKGHIRIASSSALDEEEAYEDLLREAGELPGPISEPLTGEATTTVVVYGAGFEEGDSIQLTGSDGEEISCVVSVADAGSDEEGEPTFMATLDTGEERRFRYSELLADDVMADDDSFDDDDEFNGIDDEAEEDDEEWNDDVQYIAQRSPRPALHLLRQCDLDRALEDSSVADELLERNALCAARLGESFAKDLLKRFG
eukprot:TRINITY_DN10896_c0_g1_i3.p1 TRINITY_DN10896_c0_g1~~TRINITY_DN10896_c0_g1_i3.p1  ORF type:complete len:309 (-),score=49.34 TRINITY_DN10896_c0_g1_i3:46-972(-)